ANPNFKGPDDGATVVPGRYSARIELNGRTYVQPFTVKADPQSTMTLAQMQQSYNAFAKVNRIYSSVDVMLNNLDAIGKALDAEGPSANAALDRAREGRAAVRAQLTAAYTNGEDSVSRPGSLRENLDGALTSLESFPVQAVITPSAAQFYARIDA